jgi:hypothetical protein
MLSNVSSKMCSNGMGEMLYSDENIAARYMRRKTHRADASEIAEYQNEL